MIKAVIFDMDGLLINSEPFWQAAEIEIFETVGISLTVPMCHQTMGLRIDEVVKYWYDQYTWKTPSLKAIEEQIIDRVIQKIQTHGQAMKGVYKLLDFFYKNDYPLALASSSYYRIIYTVLEKLKIRSYFEVIYSAESEIYGKPHPGIFITAAQKLGVSPLDCLVFEDSFNGVLAAKAARMMVVAVPEIQDKRFVIADRIVDSLADTATIFELLGE